MWRSKVRTVKEIEIEIEELKKQLKGTLTPCLKAIINGKLEVLYWMIEEDD